MGLPLLRGSRAIFVVNAALAASQW